MTRICAADGCSRRIASYYSYCGQHMMKGEVEYYYDSRDRKVWRRVRENRQRIRQT